MAMLARLAGNLMPYSGVSRAAMLTPDRTHSGVPSGPPPPPGGRKDPGFRHSRARRTVVTVSEQDEPNLWPAASLSLAELARLQHAEPVTDSSELAADIWDSDEELDAFLADLRESRNSSLG